MYNMIRAVLFGSFLLGTTILAYSQSYTPGVVRVKLKESTGRNVQTARLAQHQFGIAAIDNVSTQLAATSVQRVFRESPRYEKAHKRFGLHLWYEIHYDARASVAQALTAYRNTGAFETVEAVKPYLAVEPVPSARQTAQPAGLPGPVNDPEFGKQWHYQNTGQSGGTPGADVSLPEAWVTQTGSTDVIVAVIDGGIEVTHPDLAASLWVNADEIPNNNRDDDNNGYVDDYNGYGFGDNEGRIYAHYHGTHVGGTIAAVTNNNTGVSGIAGGTGTGNGVRLMSCATFGSVGTGGFEDAMVYAADNGAVISQNSWRGGSTAIEAAVDYFVARAGYDNSDEKFDDNIQIGPMAGGIVIFAAGNDNTSEPTIGYPASYPAVVAVASTDHRDIKSYFSNFGPWVDIAAPGSDVYSTYPVGMGGYAYLSGTSMACPHVSGVAALIISQFKGPSFSPNQVWDRLQYTADDIDAVNESYIDLLGSGRVNAFNALQVADDVPPATIADLTASEAKLTSILLQWTAPGASGTEGVASYYDIRYATTPITEANFNAASQVAHPPRPQVAGTAEAYDVKGLAAGTTYYFAIKSRDFFGNVAAMSNVVSLATLPPPVIRVTPSSLSASLLSGAHTTRTITIQNTGGSALNWSILLSSTPTPENIGEENPQPEALFKPSAPALAGFNNNGVQVTSAVGRGPYPQAVGDFHTKANSSIPLTCMAVDPNTGLIYAQGNGSRAFFQYNPSTDVWTPLPDAPVSSGNNGGATYLGGKIYTTYTDGSQLGVYNIHDNSWATVSTGMSGGTGNIAADDSTLYLVRLNEVKRYSPQTNRWTNLATAPFYFELWGGLSYYQGAIYGHQGNGYAGFGRYDIATNAWTMLPNVPGGAVLGSAIDRSTGVYYAYGSYGGMNWYAYNIEAGTWAVQTLSMFSVDDGGLVYVPQAGVSGIYFLQGQAGTGLGQMETESFSNWLRSDQAAGQLAPGASQVVTVTIDAGGLYGGVYHGAVNIAHNEPGKPTVVVPVELTVTGAPDIELNFDHIHYGDVYIGAQRDSVLTITNNGTDNLTVSAMTINHASYQFTFAPFTLTPRQTRDITITFRPTTVGTFPATLTITTNDPDETTVTLPVTGKALMNTFSVAPAAIALQVETDNTDSRPITITNGGTAGVTWTGSIEGDSGPALEEKLESLNENSTDVTGIIPNRFDFYEGEGGTAIGDGGNDMYDGGNYLFTDVGGDGNYFNYTNGTVLADAKLGGGGKYFTAKYPGLFVFAADVAINSFTITGNLGADGGGYVDGVVLTTTVNGATYKGFVKRVYGAGDPSVNHLVIIEDNGTASHSFSAYTDSDYHQISGLAGVDRLYYLLFASQYGTFISNAQIETIMAEFISAVKAGASWLSLSKTTGSLAAGVSESIQARVNTEGMDGGVYHGKILVSDNIPFKEPVSVPVTLTVVGRPDIKVSTPLVNFGSTFVGAMARRTINIRNAGSEVLDVSSIGITGSTRFSVTPSRATILPKDSVRLTLDFYPEVAGAHYGAVRIVSNDPNDGEIFVDLQGIGITPPVAQITPDTMEVRLLRYERKDMYVTIRNTGGDNMAWSWSGFPYYAYPETYSGYLLPNQEQVVKVMVDGFNQYVGEQKYWIAFTYNSPVQPTISIPMIVNVMQNRAPFVMRGIQTQTMAVNAPTLKMNLAETFYDEDGEPLRYYISLDAPLAQANILGSELSIAPRLVGSTYASVWAIDALGERAETRFRLEVTAVLGVEDDVDLASLRNYPNPFTSGTVITYDLKRRSHVQLQVHDVTGRWMETLVDEEQLPGEQHVPYAAEGVPAGMYFYRLAVDGKMSAMRKMVKY